MQPSSQKIEDRPIAFLMDKAGEVKPSFTLNIRPEELSHTEPSRFSVHQTLDGAWVDSFGPGIKRITIAGHTGWRAGDKDGIGMFKDLRQYVFEDWHKFRDEQLENGKDPDDVKLVFVDNLDNICSVVAPTSFVLKRSKSRPLLMQYSISLDVIVADASDAYKSSGDDDESEADEANLKLEEGLKSLLDSLEEISQFAQNIKEYVDENLVQPIARFVAITQSVMREVESAVREVESKVESTGQAITSIPQSLIEAANGIAAAGVNIFRTLSIAAGLPSTVKVQLMEVAGSFHNFRCLLKNAFKVNMEYPDFSSVYGASVCSSTSGGRPLSPLRNTNPFSQIVPSKADPVVMTSTAAAALDQAAKNDPVLSPMTSAQAASLAGQIADGVKL